MTIKHLPDAAIPSEDVQRRVYEAVHATLKVFGAPGVGDCLYHATATVGALRAAGIDAQVVAGAVWWRTGPGPGGASGHGYDQYGRISELMWSLDRPSGHGGVRIIDCHAVALYHVEGAPYCVDMTTYQLTEKARLYSQATGMPLTVTTQIPAYYWGPLPPQRVWIPPQRPWSDAKPGDWCFTPIDGLAAHILNGTGAEHCMTVAPIIYENPNANVSIRGGTPWKPENRVAAVRAPTQGD